MLETLENTAFVQSIYFENVLLGWYPQHDIEGNYILLLARGFDWSHPLEEFSSRSKVEVIACIEKWVDRGFFQKYQMIEE